MILLKWFEYPGIFRAIDGNIFYIPVKKFYIRFLEKRPNFTWFFKNFNLS
jgi:hypothetical protein